MNLFRHLSRWNAPMRFAIVTLLAALGLAPLASMEHWLVGVYNAPPGEMFGPTDWKIR